MAEGGQLSRTSWSRCVSLEGSVGGKWSRSACCFSCRREGTNLWDERFAQRAHLARAARVRATAQQAWGTPTQRRPRPTHWSLQMQMMGLIRIPPSARRRRPPPVGTAGPPGSASCRPWRSKTLRRTLMAAWGDMQTEVSHSPHCLPTRPQHTQEAHRGGPVDLIDNQAVGPPTSAQHRLHLRGCLDARSEGLRAAVITGTKRPGRGCQGSHGLSQGSSQCPQQDNFPGQSHHVYNSRILHKATP